MRVGPAVGLANTCGQPAGTNMVQPGPPRTTRPATIGINHPQAGLITLQMFQLRLVEQPDLIMVIQVPDRPADTGS
jgi:hypothetical protein